MPYHHRGPEQTDTWPLVWANLDPTDLPAWIVWERTCDLKAEDGMPCPRRVAGIRFGVDLCDHHWPPGVPSQIGRIIG